MRRKRPFEYSRDTCEHHAWISRTAGEPKEAAFDTMVCTAARGARHDHNVSRTEQDGYWKIISRETSDKKDRGTAQADGIWLDAECPTAHPYRPTR